MKRVFCIVMIMVMMTGLAACTVDRSPNMPADYTIIKTGYPKGVVDRAYNFEKYINKLEDMKYSLTVESGGKRLSVDGFSFTPTEVGTIKITVVCRQNRYSKKETVSIEILASGVGEDIEVGDLSESKYVSTRKPPNYGTTAILTDDERLCSTGSTKSLKGVFNNDGANTYDNSIWTWVEFNVGDAGFYNLKNKYFRYDVNIDNCGFKSSIILEDINGNLTAETFYSVTPGGPSDVGVIKETNGAFMTITIDLGSLFRYNSNFNLRRIDNILIMFSNYEMSPWQDSIFHIDNAYVLESDGTIPNDIPVYNPSGTYDKTKQLGVLFCGNSFIGSSMTGEIFQDICLENGANVIIFVDSIGYGRVKDHMGIFQKVDARLVDVVFFQDFYGAQDVTDLGSFLQMVSGYKRTIEIIVYPAENETDDGMRAASLYGLDIVNWKKAIKTIKRGYPHWSSLLNIPNDPIEHSTPFAGLIGAIMQYMALYGEMPEYSQVVSTFEARFGSNLPGSTYEEKLQNVQSVIAFIQAY